MKKNRKKFFFVTGILYISRVLIIKTIKIMTNSQKVRVLERYFFSLNPFTEQMFGEKTYHFDSGAVSVSMDMIARRNKAIIKQSELDAVNSRKEFNDLLSSKLSIVLKRDINLNKVA